MFTGIIEEVGYAEGYAGGRLRVRCSRVLDGTGAGDSIAVSGVCLTVTEVSAGGFAADVSAETAASTTLRRLSRGAPVNLERAARLGQLLGGHIVQGHVDATGRIVDSGRDRLRVKADREAVLGYCIKKGSIAVDGISLTIAAMDDVSFTAALIPYTFENTNLGGARVGDEVNLEVDIIAKYVKKFVAGGDEGINEVFLTEHGYF